jgi:Fic family protein
MAIDDAFLQRTQKFIASTNDCLRGSPYQFPDDEVSINRYQQIEESLRKIQEKLSKVPDIEGIPSTLKSSLRTQEVYESNALEGLGTDLGTTNTLIEGTSLEHKSSKDYVEWAITRGIQNDKHFYDVIGLTAARGLSRDIATIVDRPITESDIRTIHEVILAKEEFAGIYKLYPNSISGGNPHQTTLPTDTPGAMQQFIDWTNGLSRRGSRTSLSIVKAAAIHAWLTHIHPFHDGNGRLARLLANMILAREEMPPLILRNESHRGRYLDALSFSDSGGDISKLILVFCRAIERVIDDMLDPKLAQQMFQEDINLRLSDEFKNWETNLQKFQVELEAALLFHRLSLIRVGGLTPSEFKALQKGKRTYKTWWSEIRNSKGDDIALLDFGFMPDWTRTRLEKDEHYPCLFFSARNRERNSLKKYLRPERAWMRRGHTHVVLQPLEQRAYIWGENSASLQKVTYAEAAKQIALTCSEYSLNPI